MTSVFGARSVKAMGTYETHGFRLRLFAISGSGDASLEHVRDLADTCLSGIERFYSDEFEYHRVGFFVAHFGRRGVTIMLFHFGAWVDMAELFHASWYSYIDTGVLEELDAKEPLLCIHDVELFSQEVARWRACVSESVQGDGAKWEDAYASYLEG